MSDPPALPVTHAILSDLTDEACEHVLRIWDRLEEQFALRRVRASELPHITFIAGKRGCLERLQQGLASVVVELQPLEVELTGVGVFSGPHPVVFLRVEKHPCLEQAHALMTHAARQAGMEIAPHYRVEEWTPHVTLAAGDLEAVQLPAVLSALEQFSTQLTVRLESVTLLEVTPPRYPRLAQYPFLSCP